MNVIYRGMSPLQALEQGDAEYQALVKNLKADEQEDKRNHSSHIKDQSKKSKIKISEWSRNQF